MLVSQNIVISTSCGIVQRCMLSRRRNARKSGYPGMACPAAHHRIKSKPAPELVSSPDPVSPGFITCLGLSIDVPYSS